MNKFLKSLRRTAQSAVVTMLLVGIATPACTTSHGLSPAAAANTPTPVEASSVRQQNDQAQQVPSLVFLDESHKSLLVEPDAEPTEACTSALYIEEPLASGYVPVSELDEACNALLIKCVQECYKKAPPRDKKIKKGTYEHRQFCRDICQAAYMVCLRKAGALSRVFDAMDAAWTWISENKGVIIGTIVVVGGVAYVVSTGGSGALVLVPLLG